MDYNRDYRKKNLDRIRKNQKLNARKYYATHHRSYKKDQLEILQLLGNKCVRCGFSDPRALQIDHVKGNGRERKRKCPSEYYKRILLEVKAGSKDYQCLCANCNWIKRIEKKEN